MQASIIIDFGTDSKFARFSCVLGCHQCCGYAYFLPSELEKLPFSIKQNLILKGDKYEITKKDGRCFFFEWETDNDFYCTIHEFRPIRCRIYPYFPLIVDKRIVITLEPALKMLKDKGHIKSCPGIGTYGKPLKNTIRDCLSFIKNLRDSSSLLATVIFENEAFNNIRNDRWFIEQ
ncbi:MAG: YkgJ family cysteine cluster protein [Candidatus Hodarchaeota archaeon]